MKTISRYIMTLALLLTAVTGAWAQGTLNVVEIAVPAAWEGDNSNMTTADLTGFKASTLDEAKAWTGAPKEGYAMLFYAFDGDDAYYVPFDNGEPLSESNSSVEKNEVFINSKYDDVKFYYIAAPAGPVVTWNASTKTGTFSMPGSDVVLTPIYAKAAAFATTGTEPDVKTLLPEAAEGVIADTDDPLIKEGTGIVAFAGTSTEVTQGTLMYAVTPATVTEAPALDAANKWSADVPTAKTVAEGGIDVLVWYYIQGADAPQGEAATLDNTFSDTEPACLTVQVLTNKFDIQLNAANANTIEAGKATVTVGGTAATVTDGKLQGVKMGSEVKLEAKPGYKFRKVEVKKKAEAEGHAFTSAKFGEIVGSDGKAYAADDKDNLPSGVTAVAMICYVSGSHGLALALTDEGQMNWSTAQTTCAAHTPAITGGTWKLATKDEWDKMISAAGSTTDLRNGFSSVGVTNMQTDVYWASTEYDSSYAYYYDFYGDYWNVAPKGNGFCVRACLAF